MGAVQQILLGTGMLTLSALVHVTAIVLSIPYYRKFATAFPLEDWPKIRVGAFLSLSIFVLVFSHTIQIWAWAIVFVGITNLPDLVTSFYFTTVTYTTLGYGDIVLGPEARIVATFSAVTGLLTFGISTAFLIGVLSRVLPSIFDDGGDQI